jgi:hypothetical protein
VRTGPQTPQERWENQSGYSPATIAADIAGLVCAADIAKANGDAAARTNYLATADEWRRHHLTNGGPWDIGFPAGSRATRGRLGPLFAGERGEYEIAADGARIRATVSCQTIKCYVHRADCYFAGSN